MLLYKYVTFFVLLLVAGLLVHTCLRPTDKKESDSDPVSLSAKKTAILDTLPNFPTASENARLALIVSCGRCHQSTLESHKPGAVAIFDLDEGEQWHSKLTLERLPGMERRAKGNASLSEEEKDQIVQFITLKRAQLQ